MDIWQVDSSESVTDSIALDEGFNPKRLEQCRPIDAPSDSQLHILHFNDIRDANFLQSFRRLENAKDALGRENELFIYRGFWFQNVQTTHLKQYLCMN